MPGFTAERSMTRTQGGRLGFAVGETANTVRPAMMILVDGVPYCEGEVTDSGIQCYGGPSGSPGGGGGNFPTGGPGGGGDPCPRICRSRCGGKTNTPCYRNCLANC
jgi:hypothetical protein